MSDDRDDPSLPETTAASDLVNGAVVASLVLMLRRKGVLTTDEVREVYEFALMVIEEQQAAVGGESPIFDMARDLIERHLR